MGNLATLESDHDKHHLQCLAMLNPGLHLQKLRWYQLKSTETKFPNSTPCSRGLDLVTNLRHDGFKGRFHGFMCSYGIPVEKGVHLAPDLEKGSPTRSELPPLEAIDDRPEIEFQPLDILGFYKTADEWKTSDGVAKRQLERKEPPDHVRLEDVAGQMNFLMMDKLVDPPTGSLQRSCSTSLAISAQA
eukprot:s88_g24.t1